MLRLPAFVLPFVFAAATVAQTPTQPLATTLADEVRTLLAKAQQQRGFSGVSTACVLPDGEIVAVALGADAAAVPLTAASKLMSGSIGKTYCAAVALQLVHDGKLRLDGRVQDVLGSRAWYGRVPNADTITLRQLLNHTSGIPEHVWKKAFQDAAAKAGDRAMTPEECIGHVLGDAPLAPAGEKFAYADTNYVLAGLCIEQVTGKSFFVVLRERVLEPLHLQETIPNERREIPGLACGMAGGIGFHEGPTVVDGKYFTNPVFEYCGGGISSSTRDLARWTRELFAGDVVPKALRGDQLTGVPAPRNVSGSYGLGCFLGTSAHGPAYGHSGVMPGYLSYALYYPDLRVAVAVQFPTDDGSKVGNMRRLCDDLAALAKGKLPAASGAGK